MVFRAIYIYISITEELAYNTRVYYTRVERMWKDTFFMEKILRFARALLREHFVRSFVE